VVPRAGARSRTVPVFVESFRPETRMALDFRRSEPATARDPLTVSALNRAVAGLLTRSFPLVRVRGEIANLTRAASGHWYFVLKDADAQVRCVMFRTRNQLVDWAPRDGDDVEVSAVVTLYEPRGEFQIGIEAMRRAGQGRLAEEFMRLKARLAAEGLFDAQLKRPLPVVPRRVGVVTSLQAAALRDVLTCLARRAPYVTIVVYPVPVQGGGAAPRIVAMLDAVGARAEVDVVLLVRGGGSIEDLWAFNDEAVARAIRACALPVVVGVGHESDITIADFAADVRAPTPTAAAELVAPARDALLAEIAGRLAPLKRCLDHHLHRAAQRLDYAQRALATPRAPTQAWDARLAAVRAALAHGLDRALAAAHSRHALLAHRFARCAPLPVAQRERAQSALTRLHRSMSGRLAELKANAEGRRNALALLDPTRVLARGFSVVRGADGRIVRSASQLAPGVRVALEFERGNAEAIVERVHGERER
jgi:exodeoxyribonuclease VII large subunit